MLLLAGLAHAAFLGGVAYAPPGIGAFSFTEAEGFSGTLVGEFDGWLRPPLTAHGGWAGRHDAILGNVAFVEFADEVWSDASSTQLLGSVRLGADYRRYVFTREGGRANAYGTGGVYGLLPHIVDENAGYSLEESADASLAAAALAARVGGLGAQAGLGAEYVFADKAGMPAVAIGARYLVRVWRAQAADDDSLEVSTVWTSEAALVLEFTR